MEFCKLTVSGSGLEMGHAFGDACADGIRALLDSLLQEPGEKLEKALRFVPLYERWFPRMLEELRGIAQALDLTLAEALLLQTRWDLRIAPAGECTSFACAAPVTRESRIFAGMNKDVSKASRDQMILLHMLPDEGPRKLLIAYPGSMAGPGMNEYGVCMFGNSLYGGRARSGSIPQPIMHRLVLEQKTAAEAVRVLTAIHEQGQIGFSGNVTVCDASGDMYCVEMLGDQIAVVQPEKGFLVHANHLICQVPSMLAVETPGCSGNTFGRGRVMKQWFEDHRGILDEELLKTVLRDHTGGAFGICRHNGQMPGREPTLTAMSCVAMPAEGRIWFCKGNPCENPYRLYTV